MALTSKPTLNAITTQIDESARNDIWLNKVIADFAAQDAAEANKSVRNMVDNMTNANLVGAV